MTGGSIGSPSEIGPHRPLRIVIAPDKFRGSMTARDAASAIARGVERGAEGFGHPVTIQEIPLADGGEGTAQALVWATGGQMVRVAVEDPLGRPIEAEYGILGDGRTAVIEMATASGQDRLKPEEKDPTQTTTRGTGQLIADALDRDLQRILVGIGGSATNDGGIGMAEVLGYRFLDADDDPIPAIGGALGRLHRVEARDRDPRLNEVSIEVACDVTNPLYGPKGASVVYGPQKGATPAMVSTLDAGLVRLAEVISRDLGVEVADLPGAGAAGGLGAGLVAFTQATLRRGIDLVLDSVQLADRLRDADLCLTGEGKLDASSTYGKTVAGVAALGDALGIPVVVLAGTIRPESDPLLQQGVTAAFAIPDGPMSLNEAIRDAEGLIARLAEQIVRLWIRTRTG